MFVLHASDALDRNVLAALLEAGGLPLAPTERSGGEPDLMACLLASRSSGGEALTLVAQAKAYAPVPRTVLCCPRPTERERSEILALGVDLLVEPAGLAPEQFAARLLSEAIPQTDRRQSLVDLKGGSAPMQRVYDAIERVARLSDPVLVIGETGTGKDLVAKAIHSLGKLGRPWVAINISASSSDLVSSDLFGHEVGAFTGASKARKGLLAEAADGSVLLDEIGDLDERTQVKLLRVIEDRRYRTVGGNREEPLRARLLLATHRNLEQMIEQGRFRQDLYERMRIFEIRLPPLRERMEDLPVLAGHFLGQFDHELGTSHQLPSSAVDLLFRSQWPGNVRELRGVIRRAANASEGPAEPISHAVLREAIRSRGPRRDQEALAFDPAVEKWSELERRLKRAYFQRALEMTDGRASAAADMAGISRTRFYELLKELGIELR